jgi:hypothetical protein
MEPADVMFIMGFWLMCFGFGMLLGQAIVALYLKLKDKD